MNFALALMLSVIGAAWAKQKLCVKGKVECPSEPENAKGQILKLFDRDTGFNPDDRMGEGVTNPDGSFELCGSATDIVGNIDPELRVYTACKNQGKEDWECYRTLKFPIPTSSIGKTHNFTEPINLDNRLSNEENKCLRGSWIRDIASGELIKNFFKTGFEYFHKGTAVADTAVEKIEKLTT